ncbi:flagellar biosynthesis regulator FlaF [Oryzicola mucosus]|uniref:Flagellar biosynthesis regulator FlaF n=1 Tax=Oryzicola mucosus TaxID=2767425 RepID=A0A8J6U789_9HYPH|nr:flagellar biosynthesis regulator FlaF [Oryzicola mucosus]MBD0414447.1 flagellar biosynthesis regulator FlaF [Oryzicola mucosus]
MYQLSYDERQSDTVVDARNREKQVLDRSIEMLMKARASGADSREATAALQFTNRVWTTFLNDLENPESALPNELRTNLISVGMWVLRESEAIRKGRAQNFDGLIEVSQFIRDGLQ